MFCIDNIWYYKCHDSYHQYYIKPFINPIIDHYIISIGHIDQYHCILIYIYIYIMSNQLIMTYHD